jgi:hypothetical protein
MTNPLTTVSVSRVRSAQFAKAIAAASSVAELQAAAEKHGDWLLGNDRERLRVVYGERLAELKGGYATDR